MEQMTAEAHQAWIRTITVRAFQGLLVLLAVIMAFVFMNVVSDNESDATDFAECIARNIGPCD